MSAKIWIVVAALLAGTAVALGAWRAHGLEQWLTDHGTEPQNMGERLGHCDVAIRYQMYHALALLSVAAIALRQPSKPLAAVGSLFVLGVLLFSGSLYALVFDLPIHPLVTPLGGVVLLLGWIGLALAAPLLLPADSDS